MEPLDFQLHAISKGFSHNEFTISDMGDLLPASLMIQELDGIIPVRCSYMNKWGCDYLETKVEEINELGDSYYDRYFVKEEIQELFQGISNYIGHENFDKQYNFFQRVKNPHTNDYSWFYTVCKLIKVKSMTLFDNKLLLLSSPVSGMDSLISRVNKTLNLEGYMRSYYIKYAKLTTREKQIITLLANGNSSRQIADQLNISPLTVSTHRKNLVHKLESKSFADLLRFAIAFDLI